MIGSPAPGEVKARHPFQFVEAALYRGLDSNTLCLVEKTGFEKAKVDLKEVERKLAPATVQWITPQETLVKALNKLPVNSIRRLIGFSHGLPGIVTLRYGWEGSTNYGLAPSDAERVRLTVLADRGFGDQKFYALLEQLKFDDVVRFRQCIQVTDETGEKKSAGEWVPESGRAVRLAGARVTQGLEQQFHRQFRERPLMLAQACADGGTFRWSLALE